MKRRTEHLILLVDVGIHEVILRVVGLKGLRHHDKLLTRLRMLHICKAQCPSDIVVTLVIERIKLHWMFEAMYCRRLNAGHQFEASPIVIAKTEPFWHFEHL